MNLLYILQINRRYIYETAIINYHVLHICLFIGVCSSSEINGTDQFDLIEYCETHEIHSEEELQSVLDTYIGESEYRDSGIDNLDTVISFDLTIDYENQYVITTTVYETYSDRGSTSGYVEQNYRNNTGGSGITLGVYSDYARTNLIASASYPRTVNNPNYIVVGFPSGATRYFAAWPNITGELNIGTVAGNF